MFSITLQNNFDNQITANDVVGQLQFAAPSETDGGAAIDIVAKVYANGEGGFQSASNPTSLILATSAADASSAVDRLKVSEDGHFLPVTNNTYDLGSSSLNFKNSYISEGVVLADNTPSVTTNKLYNEGGTLKFNGSAVGGGGGLSNVVEDTTPQLGGHLDCQSFHVSGVGLLELEGGFKTTLESNTDSATITFDLDAANTHTVTLGGNRVLALSNVDVGQKFVIRLAQDATGSRSVSWFSTIKWPGGLEPTLTETALKTDVFGFICTATNQYDGYVIGYAL